MWMVRTSRLENKDGRVWFLHIPRPERRTMISNECVRGLPVAVSPEALPRYSNLSPGNMGTSGQQTSSLSVAQCTLTLSAVLPKELYRSIYMLWLWLGRTVNVLLLLWYFRCAGMTLRQVTIIRKFGIGNDNWEASQVVYHAKIPPSLSQGLSRIVRVGFLHSRKTIAWEKHEAESISLCSNSCVALVTFSSMTLESWVPPFWLPNQPMCLWGGMQHKGLAIATLTCCCSGIAEYKKNPRFFWLPLFDE